MFLRLRVKQRVLDTISAADALSMVACEGVVVLESPIADDAAHVLCYSRLTNQRLSFTIFTGDTHTHILQ
jgi:hypothetical protein